MGRGSVHLSIAVSLDAERKTIRRWLRAGKALLWSKPPRGSVLEPYENYLDGRWAEGCHNTALIWREIATRSFPGRPGIVRKWAERRHSKEAPPNPQSAAMTAQVPSGRQLVQLLMADPDALPKAEWSLVGRLLDQVLLVADAITVAKRLNALLRRRTSDSLTQILDAAATTSLRGFAASLRRDIAAIQAALDLPWTTSPVESQINRLKILKRTMYGRAGFQRLRARLLYAS